MNTAAQENGVALDWQRIAEELADQHNQMVQDERRFAEWEATWQRRQATIDASLEALRSRLLARRS